MILFNSIAFVSFGAIIGVQCTYAGHQERNTFPSSHRIHVQGSRKLV